LTDKDPCINCGKNIIPRVFFRNGSPAYSFCPFCGKKQKDLRSIPMKIVETTLIIFFSGFALFMLYAVAVGGAK
jgi:4-hydroxy-3-methylbut-2-en-1-yl diphosphate synthase IspG/GcpE